MEVKRSNLEPLEGAVDKQADLTSRLILDLEALLPTLKRPVTALEGALIWNNSH
jgi:hypothetical protein